MEDSGNDRASGALNRRLLLAVGGITLLAGCTTTPIGTMTNTAQTRPRLSGSGRTPKPPSHPAAHPASPGTGPGGPGESARPGRVETTVDAGPKAIALTIDDGPSLRYTPQVLRLLERYRVTATFSMIGRQVAQLPGVAREVAAAGHQISNHTWRHRDLQWLAPSAAFDEIDRATDVIQSEIGTTPPYFRAPYGAWSASVIRHCDQNGMTPLGWSVDPRDWARPGVSYIVWDIMRHTKTGSIILEHDGGGDREETVAALEIVIPELLQAGYRFVTP